MSGPTDTSFGLPPLSLALAGLDPAWPELVRTPAHTAAGLKDALRALSQLGPRFVQLDATHPAIRPRDLDRSARRDLAAHLRRLEFSCSGLDAFVPPEHLASTATVDRAVAAITGAIELAADLAALAGGAVVARRAEGDTAVSVTLPDKLPADVLASLTAAADLHGVRLADHALPIPDRAAQPSGGPIGIGLDPAGCHAANLDPVALASSLADRLVSARLSDTARSLGATRIAPGSPQGRLDLLAYAIALMTSPTPRPRPLILDLRGVSPRPPHTPSLAAVLETINNALSPTR